MIMKPFMNANIKCSNSQQVYFVIVNITYLYILPVFFCHLIQLLTHKVKCMQTNTKTVMKNQITRKMFKIRSY